MPPLEHGTVASTRSRRLVRPPARSDARATAAVARAPPCSVRQDWRGCCGRCPARACYLWLATSSRPASVRPRSWSPPAGYGLQGSDPATWAGGGGGPCLGSPMGLSEVQRLVPSTWPGLVSCGAPHRQDGAFRMRRLLHLVVAVSGAARETSACSLRTGEAKRRSNQRVARARTPSASRKATTVMPAMASTRPLPGCSKARREATLVAHANHVLPLRGGWLRAVSLRRGARRAAQARSLASDAGEAASCGTTKGGGASDMRRSQRATMASGTLVTSVCSTVSAIM
eukprot:scaffold63559_cov75-Phaeocystis_antarctica.AAC.7